MNRISPETALPANNVSQQLFFRDLPNCNNRFNQPDFKPSECCSRDKKVQQWYMEAPSNLWNAASNYQGGPGANACTDIAFARQCFLSQYYNYLSKNNVLDNKVHNPDQTTFDQVSFQ